MILTSFQPGFLPILKAVQDLEIVTLNPPFSTMLNESEIAAKSLAEFGEPAIFQRALTETTRIVANLYHTPIERGNLDIQDPAFATNQFLASYAYQRLHDVVALTLLAAKIKPKLILLHNDVEPVNRALALWSLTEHVPCLHVPHAIYLDHNGRGPAGTDVHDLITASVIACAGPYQQSWYIERGAYPQTTLITGLPQFDRLANPQPNHKRAARLLGLDATKPIVVYKSSWRQDTNLLGCHDGVEETYLAFLAATKQLPSDLQFLVSCHPRGNNTKQHIELAEKANVNCLVTQEHLDVIMNAADVFLCYGPSNVILECATLGTAHLVIINDDMAFPQDPEIVKIPVDSTTIAQTIQQCLTSSLPDYNAFVTKYLGPLDGRASERIAALIRQIAQAV